MSIKIQRQKEKELKEIQKLERELARPRGNTYLWYLLFVITIVYIADEITSTIGNQMSSVIAQNLFAPVFGTEFAVARMGAFGAFALIGTFGSFLYKPLSDKPNPFSDHQYHRYGHSHDRDLPELQYPGLHFGCDDGQLLHPPRCADALLNGIRSRKEACHHLCGH